MSLGAFALDSCYDYSPADGEVPADLPTGTVTLAMSVAGRSGQDAATRLSSTSTMTDGSSTRTVTDFHVIPFRVARKIVATDNPLLGQNNDLTQVSNTQYHYFGNVADVPSGTASFLAYCRATTLGGDAVNGAVRMTDLSQRQPASAIYFEPKPIYDVASAHATAQVIARLLTDVAGVSGWQTSTSASWKMLFDLMTNFDEAANEYRLLPASSPNVRAMLANLRTDVEKQANSALRTNVLTAIDVALANPAVASGSFPATIGLPDGAACVKWNGTQFVPQPQASTQAATVSQNRYAYPAEMLFYANSRINTSNIPVARTAYENRTWPEVLSLYEIENGVVSSRTRSAAIIEPLRYGIGSLKASVRAEGTTLSDADGQSISLGPNTFPLTGLLLSGQYRQGFDFTPAEGELTEYVVYDRDFEGVSLRPTSPSATFTTMVFQSKENNEPVQVALEFTNNSGVTFRGCNGLVYPGTKFYLIGQLSAKATPTEDYEKRVFTQGYITQAEMVVSSLGKAYNVVPDLLMGRLEVGVQLLTDWLQATTTVVPLNG